MTITKKEAKNLMQNFGTYTSPNYHFDYNGPSSPTVESAVASGLQPSHFKINKNGGIVYYGGGSSYNGGGSSSPSQAELKRRAAEKARQERLRQQKLAEQKRQQQIINQKMKLINNKFTNNPYANLTKLNTQQLTSNMKHVTPVIKTKTGVKYWELNDPRVRNWLLNEANKLKIHPNELQKKVRVTTKTINKGNTRETETLYFLPSQNKQKPKQLKIKTQKEKQAEQFAKAKQGTLAGAIALGLQGGVGNLLTYTKFKKVPVKGGGYTIKAVIDKKGLQKLKYDKLKQLYLSMYHGKPSVKNLTKKETIEAITNYAINTPMFQGAEGIAEGEVFGGALHYAAKGFGKYWVPPIVKAGTKASEYVPSSISKPLASIISKASNVDGRVINTAIYGGFGYLQEKQINKVLKNKNLSRDEKAKKIEKMSYNFIGQMGGFSEGYSKGFPSLEKIGLKLKGSGRGIPITKLTPKEVLEGKQAFPYKKGTTPKQLQKMFKTGKVTKEMARFLEKKGFKPNDFGLKTWEGGIHATGSGGRFGKSYKVHVTPKEELKSTDIYGQYISPELSTNFLRISGKAPEEVKRSFSLLPTEPKATYNLIEIKRLPKGVRYSISKSRKFMLSPKASGTKAYISTAYEAGKPEFEAVIPPKVMWKQVSQTYTTLNGRVVPINIYKMIGREGIEKETGKLLTTKELFNLNDLSKSFTTSTPTMSTIALKSTVSKPTRKLIKKTMKTKPSEIRSSSTTSKITTKSTTSNTRSISTSKIKKPSSSSLKSKSKTFSHYYFTESPSKSKSKKSSKSSKPRSSSSTSSSTSRGSSGSSASNTRNSSTTSSSKAYSNYEVPLKNYMKAYYRLPIKVKIPKKIKGKTTARTRQVYKPSLGGLFFNAKTSKTPSIVTGAGVRGVVTKSKRTRKTKRRKVIKRKAIKKASKKVKLKNKKRVTKNKKKKKRK